MKPCTEFSRWRKKYLEQTLTPDEAAAFAQHRIHCSACNQAFAQVQTLDALLHLGVERKAPAHFNQSVWDRIHAQATLPAAQRAWLPVWAGVGLALLLVVLGFGAYSVFRQPLGLSPRTVVAKAAAPGAAVARPELKKNQIRPGTGSQTAVPPVLAAVHPQPEKQREKVQAAQAPEIPAAVATPLAGTGRVLPAAITAFQPESSGPAPKENAAAGSNKRAAATGPKATGAGGATPGLQPGRVQVRPNTIHPGRGERVLLEVNPETAGRLEASIYTREGRLVRTLVDAEVTPGYHSWEWDGTNDHQEKVAGGIFILYVRGNVPEEKIKLAVIR